MKAKGTAAVALRKFIEEKFGPAEYARWLAGLPEASRLLFGKEIMINEWYPFRDACREPTIAMCRQFYRSSLKGAWELGRFSADFGLKGVYKPFVKHSSVRAFVKRSNTILAAYYNPCTIDVVEQDDNRAVLHITSFEEYDEYVENRIAGWMERALEIHNCTEPKIKILKSLTEGDPYTAVQATWE